MAKPGHRLPSMLRSLQRTVLPLTILCVLATLAATPALAQTFSVIHNFTGGADGARPEAALTVGSSGVLYGTAPYGGSYSSGTVFKLRQVNSAWILSPLYEFTGGADGKTPLGGVVIGPDGALYGTTQQGGDAGDGTVYAVRPPATFCRAITCYWNETVLHAFTGVPDGISPWVENLVFDATGNIYGTTGGGGTLDEGTVFELTPSGGEYTETILHNFGSGTDGAFPVAGVVLDTAGNVYGTTVQGGTGFGCEFGCGMVYQLTPSGGSWLENVLINFSLQNPRLADASSPYSALIIDSAGNLYGTTIASTQLGGGVVFKLAPSGGGFVSSLIYPFNSTCEPYGDVTMDAAGNFFGVCFYGGANGDGWVFELANCSQSCTLIDLHDFSGRDGSMPYGAPVFDGNGNLYGTTLAGGTGICNPGCGVVWEISGLDDRH